MFPYAHFWVFINITEAAKKAPVSLANKDLTTCQVPSPMLGTVGKRTERSSLKELTV